MIDLKLSEGHGSLAENLILTVMNWVPLWARIQLAQLGGEMAYYLDGRHRRIALRNLAIAFPKKDEEERKALARASFRHLGRVFGEFSFIPRLTSENIGEYLSFEGLENWRRVKEQGRGIAFLTAHFGNWEWMASAFPLFTSHPIHVIFRPLDNSFLDRLVGRLRTWTGNEGVPKQKSMLKIMRLLRSGEMVGILLDQNVAWQEGVFVNFFGEAACTNEGLALLALKTGAAVLPAFNVREPSGRYRVIIEPEIPLVRTGDKSWDVQKNTEIFTATIERYVRQYPDHWLWVHQRWKTRPWQARRIKGAAEFSA